MSEMQLRIFKKIIQRKEQMLEILLLFKLTRGKSEIAVFYVVSFFLP